MANAFNAADAAGNLYGGTVFQLQGVGDLVQDFNGVLGTVTKIYPKSDGLIYLEVMCSNLSKYGLTGPQEMTVFARQVTIIQHADGTGLVASGQGAITQTGNVLPESYNYLIG